MRSGETKHGLIAPTASRGRDGQVETVCDACRSDGADASTCSAASLLDAFDPADVGLGLIGLGRGPFIAVRL